MKATRWMDSAVLSIGIVLVAGPVAAQAPGSAADAGASPPSEPVSVGGADAGTIRVPVPEGKAKEPTAEVKTETAKPAVESDDVETIVIIERLPLHSTPSPDFPGTFNVVTREEIERTHARHIGDVLERIPGTVYVDEDGRGFKPDIGLRGLNPVRSQNVLILVDGIPMQPSFYGGSGTYYSYPLDNLERVDVIKGGAGILYGGNTVGGVINYITKRPPPKPYEASLRSSYGNYNAFTGDAALGGSAGKLRYYGQYLRKQGDGFRDNLDYEVDDGSLRLDGDIGDRSALAFDFNYHREAEGTSGGISPGQFRDNWRQTNTPNDRFFGERYAGDLIYRLDLGRAGSLRATAYANFLARNWYIAGGMTDGNNQFRRQFNVLGAEPQYTVQYPLGPVRNLLQVGARIYTDRLTDLAVKGSSPTARSGVATGNVELGLTNYALYAQNEFGLTDRLKVTPGVRFEWIGTRRNDFVKGNTGKSSNQVVIPAVGTSYRLARETFAFASFQRSFKPPTYYQAIDPTTGTDQDLAAERAFGFDGGVRSAPVDWLQAEASVFHIEYENQIISDGAKLVNAQNTLHRGVEGGASLVLNRLLRKPMGLPAPTVMGDVSLHYGVTLLDAEFRNGQFAGNRTPFAPRHQHTWSLRYARKSGLRASMDGRLVGSQFPDTANTQMENATGTLGLIPSYIVWDANVEYRWHDRGSVFVSARNVLDERYFTFRGNLAGSAGIFPSAPRTIQGGVQVTF